MSPVMDWCFHKAKIYLLCLIMLYLVGGELIECVTFTYRKFICTTIDSNISDVNT